MPISGHLHHCRQCQPYRKQADLTLSGIKRPRRQDFASDEFQSHENFECWCSLPCGHLGGNRLATAITVPDQPWRRECVCVHNGPQGRLQTPISLPQINQFQQKKLKKQGFVRN